MYLRYQTQRLSQQHLQVLVSQLTSTALAVQHVTLLGDAAAWEPRIAQGIDTVYDHAINGFNAMPPKGTCADCSDDEIKAVVDYMIEQSQ